MFLLTENKQKYFPDNRVNPLVYFPELFYQSTEIILLLFFFVNKNTLAL